MKYIKIESGIGVNPAVQLYRFLKIISGVSLRGSEAKFISRTAESNLFSQPLQIASLTLAMTNLGSLDLSEILFRNRYKQSEIKNIKEIKYHLPEDTCSEN